MKEEKPKSTKNYKRGRGLLKTEPGVPASFKLKVVLDYLEGSRDQRTVAKHYGISQTGLCYWIKDYLGTNNKILMSKKPKKKPDSLLKQVKELSTLKKELEDERLKNIALQELIQVAEKQFNIPILKKPGAKQ